MTKESAVWWFLLIMYHRIYAEYSCGRVSFGVLINMCVCVLYHNVVCAHRFNLIYVYVD